MQIEEKFLQPGLPESFHWFNPPSKFQLGAGLEIFTDAKTDFWQNTYYGFKKDNGHCLLTTQPGDLSLVTWVEFRPREKYDQCGLMVRGDQENWIKVSTEFEGGEVSRLGSVVTNVGFSDWATQDIPSSRTHMGYRISKNGRDFLLEYAFDGQDWRQMRIAHLRQPFAQLEVGVYACSPIGRDFWCRFNLLAITENTWGVKK